jgi:hypothetical protein
MVTILGSSSAVMHTFASSAPINLGLGYAPPHGELEKHKLGRKMIGGYNVSVILMGEVEAGKHVDFDIKLIDAKADPKALRVWVGVEDAKGSKKAAGTKGEATYTGEVDVPNPIPEKAKLWVEIETDGGVSKASFDYETHEHKH